MKAIYLDNAATTPVYPEVISEMQKFMTEDYGNPSSLHTLGERAFQALVKAKQSLAAEINAKPSEIYFTSGGTEANNLAIQGLAKHEKDRGTFVISPIEHASVGMPAASCSSYGKAVELLPVGQDGIIDPNSLEQVMRNKDYLFLVSVMYVNNIFGTIQDIKEMGKICKSHGVVFHTDAVQGFGKLKMDVRVMNIDMLSASAHKIGGPKGVGFLYVREGLELSPLLLGGGQEKGLRSGTENVPGILGFAKALERIKKMDSAKVRQIRDAVMAGLEDVGGIVIGGKKERIFNNLHISFPDIDSEMLLQRLSDQGILVSAGSACDSRKGNESGAVKALGLGDDIIKGSIRISFHETNHENEVPLIISTIRDVVQDMRSHSA